MREALLRPERGARGRRDRRRDPDGVVTIDEAASLETVNRRRDIFGWRESELLGRNTAAGVQRQSPGTVSPVLARNRDDEDSSAQARDRRLPPRRKHVFPMEVAFSEMRFRRAAAVHRDGARPVRQSRADAELAAPQEELRHQRGHGAHRLAGRGLHLRTRRAIRCSASRRCSTLAARFGEGLSTPSTSLLPVTSDA